MILRGVYVYGSEKNHYLEANKGTTGVIEFGFCTFLFANLTTLVQPMAMASSRLVTFATLWFCVVLYLSVL